MPHQGNQQRNCAQNVPGYVHCRMPMIGGPMPHHLGWSPVHQFANAPPLRSISYEDQRMQHGLENSSSHDSASLGKHDFLTGHSLNRTPNGSFDSPRQSSEIHLHSKRVYESDGSRDSPSSVASNSRPLKKRKKYPCHVSPVSGSVTTPEATSRTSYDSEEEKARASSPPSQLTFPHFPSLLHTVLSSTTDKVLEWLDDGKSWRIVRWDALRRNILPKFFSQLQDEKTESGSIDAFLQQLTAWGFKEITEGPDAGAYSHEIFLRDDPDKVSEMKLEGRSDAVGASRMTKAKAKVPRSILRVPSLATPSPGSVSSARYSPHSPPHMLSQYHQIPSQWAMPPGRQPVMYVNYRPMPAEEDGQVSVRPSDGKMPPYSPIRIRSSRGRPSFGVSSRGRRTSTSTAVRQRSLPMSSGGTQPTGVTGS